MNNVFFTIISTGKYKHSRQKTLKETWMSGGDLMLNKNYMFASDIDDEDNVLLSEKTDHSSAEEKHLNSLTYLCKNHKIELRDYSFLNKIFGRDLKTK